jgi:DedD protein
MNDHNLDDLIIDNIDPKNSKTKSFLTIIALAIVILIVAIILTKSILKDPNDKLILEENNTKLISPNLTLQTPKKVEHIKKELALNPNKKIKSTIKKSKTTNTHSQESKERIKKEQLAKKQAAKELKQKRIAKEKAAEAKALEAKRIKEEESKKPTVVEDKIVSDKGYFIQVGSFSKTPSSRFLSIIKNSGFNYQITAASSTGYKKLLIGPYEAKSEADMALTRVKDRINKSAFVIKK